MTGCIGRILPEVLEESKRRSPTSKDTQAIVKAKKEYFKKWQMVKIADK